MTRWKASLPFCIFTGLSQGEGGDNIFLVKTLRAEPSFFKSLGVPPWGKGLGIVSMLVLGDVHQPRSDLHT